MCLYMYRKTQKAANCFLLFGGRIIIFFKLINFVFGCSGSSLPCTSFLQLPRAGATVREGVQASHCSELLQSTGSRHVGSVVATSEVCGTFPDRIEPVSPARAGRFLTTGPPGKSPQIKRFFLLTFRVSIKYRVEEE